MSSAPSIRARRLAVGSSGSGRGRGASRFRGSGLGVGRGDGRGAGSGLGYRSGRGSGSGGRELPPRTGGEAGEKRGDQENVRCFQRSAHEAQTIDRARATGNSSLARPPLFSSSNPTTKMRLTAVPATRHAIPKQRHSAADGQITMWSSTAWRRHASRILNEEQAHASPASRSRTPCARRGLGLSREPERRSRSPRPMWLRRRVESVIEPLNDRLGIDIRRDLAPRSRGSLPRRQHRAVVIGGDQPLAVPLLEDPGRVHLRRSSGTSVSPANRMPDSLTTIAASLPTKRRLSCLL